MHRFQDWKSEQSVSVTSDRVNSERGHNIFGLLKDRTAGTFSFLGNSSHSEALNKSGPEEKKSKTRVLDPQGPFLQRWNKIFVISCLFCSFCGPIVLVYPSN
jgi:cyclic nucleotide gated channel